MDRKDGAGAPVAPPPADAINISDDGGIRKIITRAGTGATPPLHARCLVHYVGKLIESGEAFMDTRLESTSGEPQMVVAGRDTTMRERGLHLAVASMAVGESATVWVTPEYGFGEKGNFSFPTVPPNAHLVYDIDLLDFELPAENRSQSSMTYEERLEAADRRRAEGNVAFQEGRYTDALGRYSIALSFVDDDLLIQLQGFHYDRAVEARVPALLNTAACHLRLGNYHAAIGAASQAVAESPGNAKALYRRGAARHALGQTDAALTDLVAAKRAAPGDAGIARELAAVRRSLQEELQANDGAFRGLLDKAGKSGAGLYDDDESAALEGMGREGVRAEFEEDDLAEEPPLAQEGLLASMLRALCPFFFGRGKHHAA